MTESGVENMEGKTNVVPSPNGRLEPAPRSKGQWRGRNRRGRNYGRYSSQEHYRQQRDTSDRRDAYNQPQRRGAMPDLRPPPRGSIPSSYMYMDSRKGTRAVKVDCNKYATSLNHLLNFKYAPRERPVFHHWRSGSRKYMPFNKEQFVQANFQFVVRDSGDYTVHALDPDVLVEWDFIEQVRIFSHEVPSCPICLYPPVAAKITRCGHIYCWACILHYLSLSDDPWHKCPICYVAVDKKDLKSVVALESNRFSVGDTITMRLMKRAKNSVLVKPKAQWYEREFKPFRINDEEETCYSKLILASCEEVLKKIVTPEETALSAQLMEAKSEQSEEICYIEEAVAGIKARRESLSESKGVEEEVRSLMESVTLDEEDNQKSGQEMTSWKVLSPNDIQCVGQYEAAFSDEEDDFESEEEGPKDFASVYQFPMPAAGDQCQAAELAEDSQKSNVRAIESASGDSGCESARPLSPGEDGPRSRQHYYFYQADDGQNLFLSSINARCMIKEYGGLENCPDTITAEIVEMVACSQSEALRQRYRYLGHLPLTCQFVVCELDIKPPIISQGTLKFFRGELQHRKQQRQKKLRMEKRREPKTLSSSASLTSYSSGRSASRGAVPECLDLTSELEFPAQTGQLAISPPSNSAPSPFMQFAASMANQDEGDATIAEAEGANAQENQTPSPPSFAQALRSKNAAAMTKRLQKPRETVVTRKPSWAKEEDDKGGCAPVPTFQSAFTEALVSANWSEYDANAGRRGAASEESSGTRQRKNKKKVLFTNSIQFTS